MHKAVKAKTTKNPWDKFTEPLEQDIKELDAIQHHLDRKLRQMTDPHEAWAMSYEHWYAGKTSKIGTTPTLSYPVPRPSKATDPEWFEVKEGLDAIGEEMSEKKALIGEAYLAKRNGEDPVLWKLSR